LQVHAGCFASRAALDSIPKETDRCSG
jgi:hypothetical protein